MKIHSLIRKEAEVGLKSNQSLTEVKLTSQVNSNFEIQRLIGKEVKTFTKALYSDRKP